MGKIKIDPIIIVRKPKNGEPKALVQVNRPVFDLCRKLRLRTGLTNSDLLEMALVELDKRLVVEESSL